MDITPRLETIRKLDPAQLLAENKRGLDNLPHLKKGGFIKFNDKIYYVSSVRVYQDWDNDLKTPYDTSYYDLQLYCPRTNERVIVRWYSNDGEFFVALRIKELRINDLRNMYSARLSIELLNSIIQYRDRIYSNETEFSYNTEYACKMDGVEIYTFKFVAEDGLALTIEEWGKEGSESHKIFISQEINEGIEILSLG